MSRTPITIPFGKSPPAGVVTTLACSVLGYLDGMGSAARFSHPHGIAVNASGDVYVADPYNSYTVRKITAAGVVTTLAGSTSYGSTDGTGSAAQFLSVHGVTVDGSDNVYVSDYYSIRRITSTGVVTTLAGAVGSYGSSDGTGSAALFFLPKFVATLYAPIC